MAVSFQKINPKRAQAAATMTLSMSAHSTRRPSGALRRGTSMPGRFSNSGCCTGSIVIPPKAGGGGTVSGASNIRGRSMTGSANSSSAGNGGVQERGNSIILAVTGVGTAGCADAVAGGCGRLYPYEPAVVSGVEDLLGKLASGRGTAERNGSSARAWFDAGACEQKEDSGRTCVACSSSKRKRSEG